MFEKARRKMRLNLELRRALKRQRILQADLAELSYYPFSDSFPIWHHQDWRASTQPLLDAILEEEENIRQLREELSKA